MNSNHSKLRAAARRVIDSDVESLPTALEALRDVLEAERSRGRPPRIDHQKIIELHRSGMSRAEIADALGYHLGSVSSAISRHAAHRESTLPDEKDVL